VLLVPQTVLKCTFDQLRRCGRGRRECQVLWTSSWNNPSQITDVVHPQHRAHIGGFEVESDWLTKFWLDLGRLNAGVRVQVHTHPGEAFHSATDDAFPMICTPGFLSLVIPNFATGAATLEEAFLAELDDRGRFMQVPVHARLIII
jgi:hypothetical protein